MSIKLKIIPYLVFILLTVSANAQLRLDIKVLDNAKNMVNTEDVPYFEAQLSADLNGTPIEFNINDLLIVEDNQSTFPESVSSLSNGWQTVRWKTELEDFVGVNTTNFVLTYNDMVAAVSGRYTKPNYSLIIISERDVGQVNYIKFGNIPPGGFDLEQIDVRALIGKTGQNGIEQKIRLDSISTGTEYFEYNWQGSTFNQNQPPTDLGIGSTSLMDLYFYPDAPRYYRDVLTLYYDNGREKHLELTGNYHEIDAETMLQLLKPLGGQIFGSCDWVEIKWDGYKRGLPTIVEYSTDGGFRWHKAGESMDSTFVWNVPNTYTDRAKIRVRQEFTSTSQHFLKAGDEPILKISHNLSGSRLLSGNNLGTIYEWDAINKTLLSEYVITQGAPNQIRKNIIGIEYLDDSSKFVVAYRGFRANRDSLAFFNTGNSSPVSKTAISKDFPIKNMHTDIDRNFLAMVPALGNRLRLLDPLDGSLIRDVKFSYPIWSADFNKYKDTAAVYLLNGDLKLLSLPDLNTLATFDLSNLGIIENISLSPDGTMIAAAPKISQSTIGLGVRAEVRIIDIESKRIVRTFRKGPSKTVGLEFSPTSKALVIGSAGQPQVAFWDLPTNEFIGTLGGTTSQLTDFEFSPAGHSVAVSSSGFDNLVIRDFTFPEMDQSDSTFSIVEPQAEIDTVIIQPQFVATETEKSFKQFICNPGKVGITFHETEFKDGTHFSLKDTIAPFSLDPGECIDVDIIFNPLDTGMIVDTLTLISYCAPNYDIPLVVYSKNRNISFSQNVFDFGDECLGETKEKEFTILRNEDPIPLKINDIVFFKRDDNPFGISGIIKDTILAAGASLRLPLTFTPNVMGEVTRDMRVFHSDLPHLAVEADINGYGIGTFISKSHKNNLLFIPEISIREFMVYNDSEHNITITDISIDPPGNFQSNTALPITIAPGDSTIIEVEKIGNTEEKAKLTIIAEPCAVKDNLNLDFYKASSNVTIPNVFADSRRSTAIPVNFITYEARDYQGRRFFETEFTMNPRLFLPTSVETDYGEGTLIRNEIIDDKRHIGIRVEGEFPEEGVVAKVRGIAGIAEVKRTSIEFIDDALFWGKAVDTEADAGLFELKNVYEDRLIDHNTNLNILSIMPNPADSKITVDFQASEKGRATLELYDQLGKVRLKTEAFDVIAGLNSITINTSDLDIGTYRLMLRQKNMMKSKNIVIMR